MRSIVIVSFKGGAGKTTVAAGIAGELAQRGQRVLAIDTDPQGGLSAALGVDGQMGLSAVLQSSHPVQMSKLVIPRAMPAGELWVLPADYRLAGVELPDRHSDWQDRLRNAIRQSGLSSQLDWVVIDAAPGLGVLPFMALRAAERAVIACPQDYLSVRVLPHVLATCERAERPVAGIVPTMVLNRTRHEKEAGAHLAHQYAPLLLPEIPRRVALQDAAGAGEPIQIYAPKSDAAAAFSLLTERIINDGHKG